MGACAEFLSYFSHYHAEGRSKKCTALESTSAACNHTLHCTIDVDIIVTGVKQNLAFYAQKYYMQP